MSQARSTSATPFRPKYLRNESLSPKPALSRKRPSRPEGRLVCLRVASLRDHSSVRSRRFEQPMRQIAMTVHDRVTQQSRSLLMVDRAQMFVAWEREVGVNGET